MNVSIRSSSNATRVLPPQWTAIMSSKHNQGPVLFWDQTSGETISTYGRVDSEEEEEEESKESSNVSGESNLKKKKSNKDTLKQPLLGDDNED